MTRYWTVQDLSVWECLQRGDVVRGPAWSTVNDTVFQHAYVWMGACMTHLPDAPLGMEATPVWAWPMAVDLRQRMFRRWALERRHVVLTLEMDAQRVLLSDYDAWHHVLNYWYLGSESATDRFHARTLKRLGTDVFRSKPLPDVRAHALVERSWHRVFDWKTLPHRLDYDTSPQTLQGTFWEIRPEDVVGVVEYGMGRPKRICR